MDRKIIEDLFTHHKFEYNSCTDYSVLKEPFTTLLLARCDICKKKDCILHSITLFKSCVLVCNNMECVERLMYKILDKIKDSKYILDICCQTKNSYDYPVLKKILIENNYEINTNINVECFTCKKRHKKPMVRLTNIFPDSGDDFGVCIEWECFSEYMSYVIDYEKDVLSILDNLSDDTK